MVGGRDYDTRPFNLATQGQRQPGSSFKPFVLAAALQARASRPDSVWPSRKRVFNVPHTRQREVHRQQLRRHVRGRRSTLARRDDVLRQLGLRRRSASRSGTKRIARAGRADGHPHAGLAQLRDDARRPQAGRHAARHGARLRDVRRPAAGAIDGTPRAPSDAGPGRDRARSTRRDSAASRSSGNQARRRKRGPADAAIADETAAILQPRSSRRAPATRAQLPGVRAPARPARPRTTATPGSSARRTSYTVAVWVGYPDKLKPMKTEFHGEPVAGGTFPALIWHDFMVEASADRPTPRNAKDARAQAASRPRRRADADDDDHAGAGHPTRPAPVPDGGDGAADRRRRRRPTDAADRRRHDGDDAGDRRRRRRRAPAPAADRRGTADARRPRRRPAPPAAPAPATGGAGAGGGASAPRRQRRQRARAAPGGHGRDTYAVPRAQKRHGSSTRLA